MSHTVSPGVALSPVALPPPNYSGENSAGENGVAPTAVPERAAGSSRDSDPWVQDLFAFSHQVFVQRSRHDPESPSAPSVSARSLPGTDGGAYPYSLAEMAPQLANPLSPLRDRDRQALGEFFAHDAMATIEADILQRLSVLVPEPSWDTDPYDFLREFL